MRLGIVSVRHTLPTSFMPPPPFHRHWYMLLLAVDWTTATAYLLVSVVNCDRSYKWSRMLPPVALQEREGATVWLLSYMSSIGCQSDGGSFSRQQFWHTSVSTARLHSVCNRTVSRRQRVLVVVTCVLHRWDSWSFPEQGQNTAIAASPFKDLTYVTVFLLSWELQTFHWLFLETNLKLICSTPRNCFSTFAAPFLSCVATCELSTI